MSKLVIVESPAKAHTIEKFLGKGYTVLASNGHVRDLPKSTLGVDVENYFEPKYINIRGKSELIRNLKKSAKAAKEVYLATDPDREGEAISWHLASILDVPAERIRRVEFNEITKDTVKKAIASPRQLDINLVNAQQARRVLDRLVGYMISPVLWNKVQKGLSAGRVQSVATRLVVDREREIQDFQPKEYWLVGAHLQDPTSKVKFDAKFYGTPKQKIELTNGEETARIVEGLQNAVYTVSKVTNGTKKQSPSAPFTTSVMQQEASKKLGFTTKKTAMVAQMLYEGIKIGSANVGLITYMRTDSVRISSQAQEAALDYIKEQFGQEYVPAKPNVYKGRQRAQDAHEAIRPTSVERTPESIKQYLTNDQFKLYRLIYNRFLASQMSPAQYKTLSIEIEANGYLFKYSGSTLSFAGYRRAYSDVDLEDITDKLPVLTQGQEVKLLELKSDQKFTEPPARFTEGTLVRELEEKGIGRPSTYAPTISTIIDRGYIVRESKILIPTELGFITTDLMSEHFDQIVDIGFTAELEDQLDEIEDGQIQWKEIVAKFYAPLNDSVSKAQSLIEKVHIPDKESDEICEKCGARMVFKRGRFGTFLACPNFPKCRNTKAIVNELEIPCPKCGAPVVQKKSKKGKNFYGCSKYPQCDFVSSLRPAKEKCPKCGSYMVEARWGKLCSNKECAYKMTPARNKKES